VVGTAHGANTAGVYGTGDYGVYGLGSAIGVRGQSSNGTGMEATSTNGDGIHATTSNSSHSGLWVENLASGGGGWGVFATAGGTGHAVHGANSNSSGWAGYFDGKVYASAGYTSSDARLKKDVADMSYGLKDIAALRAVTFKWKDQARGDGRQLGFIAQELQKVMPELVDKDSSTGMLAVNYPALVPVLVKVIQDQEKRIAALEAELSFYGQVFGFDPPGVPVLPLERPAPAVATAAASAVTAPSDGSAEAPAPARNRKPPARLVKLTSPLALRLAGRKVFPLWAVLRHRGRKSGKDYAIPVAVLHTPTTFVIALPWGPQTNWARNVLAAGGATVRWKGVEHRVTEPTLVGKDVAMAAANRIERAVIRRSSLGDFLQLRR